MISQSFKRLLVIASTVFLTANMTLALEANKQALDLAGEKKFDEALDLMSSLPAEEQKSYEHRFLKVRILSWAGKYSEARSGLNSLTSEFPNNADVIMALGNLEYYQGNLGAAETNYKMVIAQAPDYLDAQTGLENIVKAREAKQRKNKHSWRIDGGGGVSDFENSNLSNWNSQYLRAEYATGKLAYSASAQRFVRFDETDVQLKASLSDNVRGGWDWGVEAGATKDAIFRPELSLGANLGRAVNMKNGTVIYPSVSYRYDQYSKTNIHNVQPELTGYLSNGVVLTGRLIATIQAGDKTQLGWLVEGRVPATKQLLLRGGFANAPEAINGIPITTQSLFGGATYTVDEAWDLHLNFSRDDRKDSYIRNSLNVGFTYKN